MASHFTVHRFDLDTSPLLRSMANEDWRSIWAYWGDVHESFASEKADVEQRIAAIAADNDCAALVRFAAEDRALVTGNSGPPRSVTDPDLVRVAAFRLLELELGQAQHELHVGALEPARASDLVCRRTPGLWEALSPRHALFRLNRASWPEECVGNDPFFAFGDRAVYPHPFIRDYRELMLDLVRLGLAGLDAKIAIDPARATSRADAHYGLMADYWFGCKLSRATLDSLDPDDLGETWHMRPVDHEDDFWTLPLAATVFRWSAEGPIKTLVVDEIVPRDSRRAAVGPYMVNRYLHACRDTARRQFLHVDGAVRAYDADIYGATRENPKGERGIARHYRKLFRLDGLIPDEDWGRLVAHFFRGNELVIEYFGELLDERFGSQPLADVPTSPVPAVVDLQ